jgi:hypothetical protein
MVAKYIFICATSDYHHQSRQFDSNPWRGVLDTTFYDKVVGDERQVGNFIWVPQYHVPIKRTVPVPPFN